MTEGTIFRLFSADDPRNRQHQGLRNSLCSRNFYSNQVATVIGVADFGNQVWGPGALMCISKLKRRLGKQVYVFFRYFGPKYFCRIFYLDRFLWAFCWLITEYVMGWIFLLKSNKKSSFSFNFGFFFGVCFYFCSFRLGKLSNVWTKLIIFLFLNVLNLLWGKISCLSMTRFFKGSCQ